MLTGIILISVIAVAFIGMFIAMLSRVKRCPSDKILVVYGKIGTTESSKCMQGGTTFVWPVIQDYQYMQLTPMTISINLKSALSSQQIPVDVPSTFTVAISKQPSLMQNAATRLLGLAVSHIENLASEIIFGQLRDVVAQLTIEELINDRNSFLAKISESVESELAKIGLELINVNITNISDDSGYIEALGKKASAKALNEARVEEAEKNKTGNIGVSEQVKEQKIQVSANNADASIGEMEAERKRRIQISKAEADSITGENENLILMEMSNANKAVKIAEAQKTIYVAQTVNQAEAERDSYTAKKEAEMARAAALEAEQHAKIIVPAIIEKNKKIIEAEANYSEAIQFAKGEADSIYYKLEAQAKGEAEVLIKKAEAFKLLIESSGGDPKDAVMLLLTEKLTELETIRTAALQNLKIDKVVVWDNGNGTSSSNFVKDFMNSIPGYSEVFKMAGVDMPSLLEGKDKSNIETVVESVTEPK